MIRGSRFSITLIAPLIVFSWSALALAQTPPDAPDAQPIKLRLPPPKVQILPDVPPELPASAHRERRRALVDLLGSCAALVPATRSAGADIDPAFHYLTGLSEPGASLLLSPRQVDQQVLLVATTRAGQPVNDIHARATLRTEQGFDRVDELRAGGEQQLMRALRKGGCYAVLRGPQNGPPAVPRARLRGYSRSLGSHVQQRWSRFDHMRAVKSEAEVQRLQRAAATLAYTMRVVAALVRPGAEPQALTGAIDRGLDGLAGVRVAFSSRVSGGADSAQVNATPSERALQAGEATVVELGAFYGAYAARVTRTLPVDKNFSPTTSALYQAVLAAHQQAIAAIRSGVSLARVQKIAETALHNAGYRATGANQHVAPYVDGHFIGLEVRDVGDPDGPLDAGMVIVLETGLLARGQQGVRIADMVLVTPRGQRVLTGEIPTGASELARWKK